MNKLITACLNESNAEPLITFPRELMSENETKVVNWLLDYYQSYHILPTVARLGTEFPYFMALTGIEPQPLWDIADQTRKRKRHEVVQAMLTQAEVEHREENALTIEKIEAIARTMAVSSGELAYYTRYDRDAYFRTGNGLKFGWPIIDRATGGLKGGDYMLIVGRLASKKTTLAQSITHRWWEDGKRILFVSNEMLHVDLFARFDGMVGHFNPLAIRSADPTLKSQLQVVQHIVGKAEGEIISPKHRLIRPADISAFARYLRLDAIVVDGVYLMQPNTPAMAKWERVSQVSNELKQVATDLALPLVGVTQIKRVGDKDVYDMEDLSYSDSLGQDADIVMSIKTSRLNPNVSDTKLMKNRFGPEAGGEIEVDFDTMTVVDRMTITGKTEIW